MGTVPNSNLQNMLQAAVQSVHWTYSLFWQLCAEQGILVWGDGYYNGGIKTRKTVQAMEVKAEEASLQRSRQLRELYDSLCAGDTRRPSAALSPEDLTQSEWFYLMCVSFSFPPGVGLPGKAYERRQHLWLAGANEAESKTFTRAILAKSARIQTVVCIPLLNGVVEFGTTKKVEEDLKFIQHVKSFFIEDYQRHPSPPKPALSDHSTSNPISSALYGDNPNRDDMDDDDDEEEEEEGDSESEVEPAEIVCNNLPTSVTRGSGIGGDMSSQPSELMQLDMSEDIRVGSPDDASYNLDSHLDLPAVRQSPASTWEAAGLQPPPSVEDTHYSQTVSTVLRSQPRPWLRATSIDNIAYSTQSAFTKWNSIADHHIHVTLEGSSQWLLKNILFSVPLHHNSPLTRDDAARLRVEGMPHDELSANHVLAERRRREKLNERFLILRSLIPVVTKMDKASILGDTIEYVKQLRKKIQDLETDYRCKGQKRGGGPSVTVMDQSRMGSEKKIRVQEGSNGETETKMAEVVTSVQVSIIDCDALLEIECKHREGLLLDVMVMLRKMRIEVTGLQSSVSGGVYMAELRAKVMENKKGKKASIVEVKKALNQIIPHPDHLQTHM